MARWAWWRFTGVLLVALAAGCAGDDGRTGEPAPPTEEPAIDAPNEEPAIDAPDEGTQPSRDDDHAPASTNAGVRGELLDISDVQSMPDVQRAGATVIVFPEANADLLWDAVDRLFVDRPEDLSRLGVVVVAADRLPDTVGRDTTDRRGRFEVAVQDGPSLLCIGEVNGSELGIDGCQQITAPATVTVGFGEAGLTVE